MSWRAKGVLVLTVALVLGPGAARASAESQTVAGPPEVGLVVAFDSAGESLDVANGFYVSASGHFVTTLSTIAGAASVRVVLDDGEFIERDRIVAMDRAHNLALLALGSCEESCCDAAKLDLAFAAVTPRVGEHVSLLGSDAGLIEGPVLGVVTGTAQATAGSAFYLVSGPTRPWSLGAVVLRGDQVVGIASAQPETADGPMLVAPAGALAALLKSVAPESAVTLAALAEYHAELPSGRGIPALDGAAAMDAPVGKTGTSIMGAGEKAFTFLAVVLFAATGFETIRSMSD